MALKEPTHELVLRYLALFNQNVGNSVADIAIGKLINAFPDNSMIEEVTLKAVAINTLYGTNIRAIAAMASHIAQLDIDSRLTSGDLSLVHDIAAGHKIVNKNNKEYYFYSFATKYCNWHQQNIYPIYDTFVEKMLIAYRKQYEFSSFKRDELRNCFRLKEIILDFIGKYSLTQFSLKDIDKFLWCYGQEVFPPSYTK